VIAIVEAPLSFSARTGVTLPFAKVQVRHKNTAGESKLLFYFCQPFPKKVMKKLYTEETRLMPR